jgi:hypothetical protein
MASTLGEMKCLIERNSQNAERIFPYIGGEEINNNPQHAHHRYVIDFEDFPLRRETMQKKWDLMTRREREACLRSGLVPNDYPHSVAADWPELLKIVERLTKGKRASHSTAP